MVMPFIQPDPTCICESCEAGRAQLGQVDAQPAGGSAHRGPFEQRRAVPHKLPLQPGQLDPDAAREPVAESDAVDQDAERRRRELLYTQGGGMDGEAARLAILNQRPDHSPGL